mgnify:CR=1 FL=1
MKVIGCGSIPTATIKMVIATMHKDGNQVTITEKQEGEVKPFWTSLPKHVAAKLAVGDTVTVVCVPVKDLAFATETLAVIKHTSELSSVQLFDRANYLN